MQPIVVPNVYAKLSVVVQDRLRFGVDRTTYSENCQVLACDVMRILKLVQASFDGVDIDLFAWEHLLVDHESNLSGQIEEMLLWLYFRRALRTRAGFAEFQGGLSCRLRSWCAERRCTGRASLLGRPACWCHDSE